MMIRKNRIRWDLVQSMVALWLIFSMVNKAEADTVFKLDGTAVFGRVIQQTESEVKLSSGWESNEKEQIIIPRTEIQLVLVYLDTNRLEMLAPEGMHEYLDYAEELSRFPHDPLAVDLATRLLVLALGNGEPGVQRRAVSLLSTFSLSDNQREILGQYRRWVGMEIENATNEPQAMEIKLDAQQAGLYADWLATVRRGAAEPKTDAELQVFQQMHSLWKSIVSWEEIRNASQTQQLSFVLELKIMRLEARVTDDRRAESLPKKIISRWEDARFDKAEMVSMSRGLEQAFQVDLARSIFRTGKWVRR